MAAPRVADTRASVTARCEVSGVHQWPEAFDEVRYLRAAHRHRFVFRVTMDVGHDDRAVEFISLGRAVGDWLSSRYVSLADGSLAFGTSSCEMLAREVLFAFGARKVEVSEDDENSATVERVPE